MLFQFFNPNPLYDGTKKPWRNSDCTVRSICAATGLSWIEVYKKLCDSGLQYCVMPHHIISYRKTISELGFTLVKKCKKNELQVKDIALKSKKDNKIYLCWTSTHVVCCRDGQILDTFDSSNYQILEYWSN